MIVMIRNISEGSPRLYDLGDGSLTTDPIGKTDEAYVYSAEALLCDIGELFTPGETVQVEITQYEESDIVYMFRPPRRFSY